MKRSVYACFFVLLCLLSASSIIAQQPGMPPPVPTTKILAISKPISPENRQKMAPLMAQEVPATVKLYLEGKIDQWYFQTGGGGVVFLVNATTVEDARKVLEGLPLGQAKFMEFDYIALGPLSPLYRLIAPPAK